jgi:hemerythrin-like domain-containing protein
LPEPLAGLVREHDRAADVVADARSAVEWAARDSESGREFADMLDALGRLRSFLEYDLTLHIAKEEEALFPALRDMAQLVEDMLGQHDEIRHRRALLDQVLALVDAHRDDILVERLAFIEVLRQVADGSSEQPIEVLRDRVARLDWILQGHFGDEEENLFLPAATLLSAEELERISEQMAALERASRTSG